MTLIIAEKPSLARNIMSALSVSDNASEQTNDNENAAVLDKFVKKDGCFTGEKYIVTWAFGHLFELADIEDYLNTNTANSEDEITQTQNGADASSNQGVQKARKKARWRMEDLPLFPKKYKFVLRRDNNGKTDSGVKKQFEIIKRFCCQSDVDKIVNAGDSDREGEIIVRIIVDHALKESGMTSPFFKKNSADEKSADVAEEKKLLRLWLPDQTAETIRKSISEMKEERDYDNLAYEGYARTFIDWLYGVNLTRYATLKTGTLLRVGRVIVPIVRAIYDRDMSIKNFVPEKYYAIVTNEKTNGEEIELQSKNKFSNKELDKANKLCENYNAAKAIVTGVKRKKDKLNPGKLYSLSKLQNVVGKKYKMSMADSLAAVQKLYEAGYVTYPRTNSEYLATAEKAKVKQIIEKVKNAGYPVAFRDGKSIFDDSKIESHSALTPTTKIPGKNALSPDEAKVYSAIIRRFTAVFCSEPCVCEKTEIAIDLTDVNGNVIEQFSLKGTVIVEPGWTKYDDYNTKDKVLPKVKNGDVIETAWTPREKETSPPKHYTIETLNNYLKNPFKDELNAQNTAKNKKNTNEVSEKTAEGMSDDSRENSLTADIASDLSSDNDEEDYRAVFEGLELGTEATRTGIIDNARKSGYIQLKKDVYTILPDGCYLIESLSRMNIGMDKYKTADVGKSLKKVFHGEIKINDSLRLAESEISDVFRQKSSDTDDGFFGDYIGKCPCCGGDVVKGKYGYGCKNYKSGCKFKVSGVICGRIISIENARLLLETGKTSKICGFISKNGKNFDAILRLERENADGNSVNTAQDGNTNSVSNNKSAANTEPGNNSENGQNFESGGKSAVKNEKYKIVFCFE